jgi:N-acetylglutamate synthase-like GNAT family acetyltransferase
VGKEVFTRRALSSDILQLKEIIHCTILKCYPEIYPSEVVEFFLEYHSLAEITSKVKNETVLLLCKGDKVFGTGYLNKNELGGVYIHPNYQGKAYGRIVVSELLKIAKTKNLDYVWLDSTPTAYNFYLNLGFELLEQKTDYVGKSSAALNYYEMHKKLL